MRPASEERMALLQAAAELTTPHQAPTQRELAERAQVAYDKARSMVRDMARYGALCVVRERRVAYRNRPVAEYAPAVRQAGGQAAGHFALQAAIGTWATAA